VVCAASASPREHASESALQRRFGSFGRAPADAATSSGNGADFVLVRCLHALALALAS
jgi:hypothetical protein